MSDSAVATPAPADQIVARIRDEILGRQRFLLTSHSRPDGDSIGSLRRFKDDVSEVKAGF